MWYRSPFLTASRIRTAEYSWLYLQLAGRLPLQPFPLQLIPLWTIISLLDITASIIQGSAIGPAAYVITAEDLAAAVPGNYLCKLADDTYLIIPASNEASRHIEIVSVQNWAKRNNLKLNCDKSCKVVFTDTRRMRQQLNRHHCQELCTAAAWRCSAWSDRAVTDWAQTHKLLSLTYKVLTTTQPPYLHNLISVLFNLLAPLAPHITLSSLDHQHHPRYA